MDKIDILSREEFVDNLVNLVEHIAKNKRSTSFAINGTWGSGKSFVLDMLEDRLSPYESDDNSCDKYFVIHYNCWKYDYYEEPLLAIVAAMIDIINEQTRIISNGETRAKIVGVLKSVGATLLSMANSTIKDKTGVDIKAAYDLVKEGVDSGAADFEKSKEYDVYFSFKQALNSLQELIGEISEQQTVVFVVDELDRCLPEYAIKVLERLHHLTEDSNNVITILSMDKVQLQSSINQIFGENKADQYLKKFIQFEVKLDKGRVSERFTEKYTEYLNLFDKDLVSYHESIEEFAQAVFKNIDIREQEQLIHRAQLAHQLLFSEPKDYSFLCMELLIVVMVFHYQSKAKFCKWLEKFPGAITMTNSPPFESFFEEQFNLLSIKEVHIVGANESRRLVLQLNTLYSAIAYMWIMLFLNRQQCKGCLGVAWPDDLLEQNVDELKKFIETIRFIK